MKIFFKTDIKVVVSTYADDVDIVANAESGMFRVTENGVTTSVLGLDTITLVEDVTLPDDYEQAKYIYTSNGFEANPDWDNIQERRARDADPRLTGEPIYDQPFNSWVWNSTTKDWEAPIARPTVDEDDLETKYDWDEDNQAWVKR